MATPVPKPVPPATEVVFPRRMFLQALDYNPHAKPRTKATADQANVSEARHGDLAGLHRMAEGLTTGVKHLRVADNAGHFNASITVLQVAAADFMAAVSLLSKAGANAAARYEESVTTPPPVLPADATSPSASAGAPSTGAAALAMATAQHMIFTAKPSDIQYPSDMAAAITQRNAALRSLNADLRNGDSI